MQKRVTLVVLLAILITTVAGDTEANIRARLGIPSGAKRVLILSQSSHMDWDWNKTFPDYYSSEVDGVLSLATEVLTQYKNEKHPYYYSVAETGFLQRFWTKNPAALPYLQASGHLLHMVGGGITSPDSLLNHGEAFIRNFLVGQQALRSAGLPNITNIWVPDDFGHDGQLPVMVKAMGLIAAGFARVPGAIDQGPPAMRIDGQPSTAEILMNEGVSFNWVAKDGSTMFAHWLQSHYNQGDDIDEGTKGDVSNCSTFASPANAEITNSHIHGYVSSNGPTAVSPYMFVAIGDDFRPPKPCLLTYVQNWNNLVYGQASETDSDVYVVSATFDHYVALVQAYTSTPGNPSLRFRNFEPTPYWTGFYASRPQLKILQERSIRHMLAAESLTWLTDSAKDFMPTLQHVWTKIAPSTHHDFVTGTSPDSTYYSEQLPYLNSAVDISSDLVSQAMKRLASKLVTNANVGETGIVFYNPLGLVRPYGGHLRVPSSWIKSNSILSFCTLTGCYPFQKEAEWTYVTTDTTRSLGYRLGKFSTQQPNSFTPLKLRMRTSDHNRTIIIENGQIQVTLKKAANWAATSVFDLRRGIELVKPPSSPTDDPGAFTLQILADTGNIYRFANEMPTCFLGSVSVAQTPLDIDWNKTQNGVIRIAIPTQVRAYVDGTEYTYTRTYVLYANEPFVRVEVTGAAPNGHSVFLRTPITFLQPMVTYGTPYHWDDHVPAAYWPGYNFMAIHNFLTLTSLEGISLAFYSSMLRAWALDGTVIITALFRNTPSPSCGAGYGANGSDAEEHTVELALRVPGLDLKQAPNMLPLTESLVMTTPMIPAIVENYSATNSPGSSLMEADNAVITTVKPAEADPTKQLIVRLYSSTATPTNPVKVRLTDSLTHARSIIPLTALENPYPEDQEAPVKILEIYEGGAILSMQAAIATLLITSL